MAKIQFQMSIVLFLFLLIYFALRLRYAIVGCYSVEQLNSEHPNKVVRIRGRIHKERPQEGRGRVQPMRTNANKGEGEVTSYADVLTIIYKVQ